MKQNSHFAWRCRVAEIYGADVTYPMRSIEVVHLARQNQWNPTEFCIEAVGHQMETLKDYFELIQKQGNVLAFGVPDEPVYAFEFETFFARMPNLW